MEVCQVPAKTNVGTFIMASKCLFFPHITTDLSRTLPRCIAYQLLGLIDVLIKYNQE